MEAKNIGKRIRLWSKEKSLDKLASLLHEEFFASKTEMPRLFYMGSGDFHHVSALILAETLRKAVRPVTVIHFDNHPDWVNFKNGMHCGSWVNRAIANDRVENFITIGVCSNDLEQPDKKGGNVSLLFQSKLKLFPYTHAPSHISAKHKAGKYYHWQCISQIGESAFMMQLLKEIPTEDVYITIDKDVLAREDCESNWDQGAMRLPYLTSLIRAIGQKHNVIGADVTGDYSKPKYAGSLWQRAIKNGEALLDQPYVPPSTKKASDLNSRTNQILLDVFSEVMP